MSHRHQLLEKTAILSVAILIGLGLTTAFVGLHHEATVAVYRALSSPTATSARPIGEARVSPQAW